MDHRPQEKGKKHLREKLMRGKQAHSFGLILESGFSLQEAREVAFPERGLDMEPGSWSPRL